MDDCCGPGDKHTKQLLFGMGGIGKKFTRLQSVEDAARLLGKSEKILEFLQEREIPNLDPGKATYIDEWRVFLEDVENHSPLGSASSDETT